MKLVFHRDRTIASTMGHTIFYPKGVPTHTPAEVLKEALAAGGVPEDESALDALDEPQKPASTEPVDPAERAGMIRMAIEDMIKENVREEFTASAQPHLRALKKRLGWEVSDAERNAVWAELMDVNKD